MNMIIQIVQPTDRDEWLRMRQSLWPTHAVEELAASSSEIENFFVERKISGLPSEVFIARRENGALGGFVEVSLRPAARGCVSSPVGYVEGWYVDADLRRRGVGKSLIAAAESWAREQNCFEMASDCVSENHVSHHGHLALGFQSAQRHLHFQKLLSASPAPARDFIGLVQHPIASETPMQLVSDPSAGGIAIFCGTTRGEKNPQGQKLLALEYEAYAEMAAPQLRDLAKVARGKWPIIKLAILHRTGRVEPGEPSVVIAVSTPHRSDAFEACRWIIDALKNDVAIWKKEIWADGSGSWVNSA